MKEVLLKANVQVQKSNTHGYGVFALESFQVGDIIEECPVLFIPKKLAHSIRFYYFRWPIKNTYDFIMPLGYGGVYNHSHSPNAKTHQDITNNLLIIKATKDIDYLEEIFISYGEDWFKRMKQEEKQQEKEKIYSIHDPLQISGFIPRG